MSVTSKLRAAKQGVSHANTGSGVKDSIGAETKPKESKTVTAMTPPGFAELQAALEKAMDEMARFSGTLTTLQADVTNVKTTQGKMKTDVVSIFQRLNEAEGRVSVLEDENEGLKQLAQTSAKECSELRGMITDMANRERRHNVRIFGLKENKESPSKLRERVMSFFSEALKVDLTDSELQMVHRASSKIPTGNMPPRPVIIRFQNLLEKERVWAAAKAKARVGDGIHWNDSNISVFPDMTKEVADKRKQFTEVRKKLHELNVRFTLAFPAVLRFTWKGERVSFTEPSGALELLSEAGLQSGKDGSD